MGVDVIGNNLAAFEKIASGTYNLGNVVLKGDGLSKVNNHYHFKLLNGKKTTVTDNQNVRKQLYQAIRNENTSTSVLNDRQLAAIRDRLGLDETGNIGNNEIGNADLTRREIRQIIDFVKEVGKGRELYNFYGLRGDVMAEINKAELNQEQKTALFENLFGKDGNGGQLKELENAFDEGIILDFKTTDGSQMYGKAAVSAERAMKSVKAFIGNFAAYCKSAEEFGNAEIGKCKVTFSNALARMETEVNGIKVEDSFKADCLKLIADGRKTIETTEKDVLAKIREKMTRLKFTDLFEERASRALAESNVNGELNVFELKLTKLQCDFAGKFKILKNIVKFKAEQLEQQRQATLNSGREDIMKNFAETSERISAFFSKIEVIGDVGSKLSMHCRNDERTDGDKLKVVFGNVSAVYNKALTETETLSTTYFEECNGYTADDIKDKQNLYKARLNEIVSGLESSINEQINLANGQLRLTQLPKLGEDPKEAQKATESKRAALTAELGKQWDDAKAEFEKLVKDSDPLGKPDFRYLTEEQKQAFSEQLDRIAARFGEANRAIFVNKHPAGGLTPEQILAKAKSDLERLTGNLKAINTVESRKEAQRKLDIIGGWLKGDSVTMKRFDREFKELTGFDFRTLNRHGEGAVGCLKRCLLQTLGSAQQTLNQLASVLKSGEKFSQAEAPVEILHENIRQILDSAVGIAKNSSYIERAVELQSTLDTIFGQLRSQQAALIGDEKTLTARFTGMLSDPAEKAKEILEENRRDFELMIEGMRNSIESRFIGNDGIDLSEFIAKVKKLPASFQELVNHRVMANLAIEKLLMLKTSYQEAAEAAKDPKKSEANTTLADRCRVLMSKISLELKPGCGEKTPSATLKALFDVKKIDVGKCEQVLASAKRTALDADNAIGFAGNAELRVDLGEAVKAPLISDGIDDRLGEAGELDPSSVSVLDKIIKGEQ